MYAWAKEQKKVLPMKIGFGKIFYKDTWQKWEDKEKLVERICTEEKRNKVEKNNLPGGKQTLMTRKTGKKKGCKNMQEKISKF